VLNSCELIAASGSDLRFSDDDIARIMQAGARQPVISRRRGSGLRTALMSGRNDDFTMIVTIASTGRRCACVAEHGGSGHYVFLGPDGGPCRRSNYGRRVFRPACDGRHEAAQGRAARLVIADATIWPGVPVAAWPPVQPGTGTGTGTGTSPAIGYAPPRGRGSRPSRRTSRSPAGSRSARPDRSWPEAEPQDQFRGRHPGDPRRAAARP
jgi:hypothetical protein